MDFLRDNRIQEVNKMADCLFCKIIAGEIPSTKVYEDDYCYAFKDIAPQMPVHIIVVPKKHFANVLEYTAEDIEIAGRIQIAIANIAREQGFAENGFRVINNCGRDAMQTVHHIHYHILAGGMMGEKIV
jgi:histidine triad (HIT) family protein